MSANRANEGLKLLKTAKWHEWQKQAILEVAENPVFLEPDTHGKLEDLVLEADILFGSPDFSPAILAKSKTLKLVHVGSTGVDRYMIPEFQQSDIILVNSRGVHGATVADHAMAMLLALSRGLHDAWEHRHHKKWEPRAQSIVNLPGKTAGLLGLGAIGTEVAARCKAFGMRVIGIRRDPRPSEPADLVLPPSNLDRVLEESDFAVCSLPLTGETRHLLTIREFSLMKPTAFFINVGRGAVVKEQDLIAALSQGLIKGAGLDVFEEEPLPEDSPLWDMPNVIITPHTAGIDEDHAKKTFDIFLQNLDIVPSYVVMTLIDNYGVDYNAEERTLHTVYTSGKPWSELLTSAVNEQTRLEYLDLQDAINDAGEGHTIKLLRNVRLKTTGLVVGAEKNVTLDLAGHVLSGVFDNEGSSALITNHGTLTIIDTGGTGKITNQALNPDTEWEPGFPAYANNTITNHGQLIIQGGRIENTTGPGASYVIDNNSTISDAVVVIDGGYIVNPNNNFAIRQFANSTKNKNSVTINDGVVEGTRAVWIHLPGSSGEEKLAELTVTGGTLRSTDKEGYNLAVYSYTHGDSFEKTTITINGGIFDGDIALTGGNPKVPTETVQVTGGYFKGGYGVYSYGDMGGFITGGYFNTEATAYLAPGYTFVESDEPGYKCMVVQGEGRIVNLTQKKAYETIQDAVTAATPGDTILATAGTYEVEQIKITKRLTLMGVGDESVIQATTNKAVLVTEADGITIKDLKLVGAEEPGAGIKIGSKVAIDGLTIDNCTIEGFTNGIYADSNSADEPVVKNVLIRNTRFIGNSVKGIYVEKLSESTIENCYFEGNGYDHYAGAGIDINAKFADYKDITMKGCTFVENGVASDHGGGILVKARGTGNDDAYSSNPATLTNVTIEDCTFENNKNAIVLGEYGKNNTGPTNVVITGSTYINNGQDVVDYRKLDEGAPEEAGNTFLNSDVLDIPPLDNAIEAARAVKEGIAVSQDGVDVPAGTYWVTPENMEALDEAIAAAEAAKATVRTQQEVAEAVEDLEAAIKAFNDAKREVQEGIDEEEPGEGEELEA